MFIWKLFGAVWTHWNRGEVGRAGYQWLTDCMQIIVGKFEGGEGEGIDDRLRRGIRRVTCVRTQRLRSHLSKEKNSETWVFIPRDKYEDNSKLIIITMQWEEDFRQQNSSLYAWSPKLNTNVPYDLCHTTWLAGIEDRQDISSVCGGHESAIEWEKTVTD